MKNILFTTLILLSTATTNNVPNAYDYTYNLPIAINENIELINDTNYTTIGNVWNINNTMWYNNQMPARQFLSNICSILDTYGESSAQYENVYHTLTNNYFTNNQYNYCLVIDSFIDNSGNHINLEADTTFFIDVARITIDNGSIFIDNNFNMYGKVFSFNLTTNYIQDSAYTIDYILENAQSIYITGFVSFSYNAVEKRELDFITQVGTYINYGSKLNDFIIDYKECFKNLTFKYYDTINVNKIYPYYHLNNLNYNTLYYKGFLSAGDNGALYKRVAIFEGLFKSNDNLYTTILYNYKVIALGSAYEMGDTFSTDCIINDITITCTPYEYVIILDYVEYYNKYNGNSIISYANNATLTGYNTYTIKNTYELLTSMKTISLYYTTYYGLNYYNETNVGGLNFDTLKYIQVYITGNDAPIINAPYQKNYLENLLETYNGVENVVYVGVQYDNTNIITNVFDLFSLAFGSILTFFNIMIFPNITIGLLLMVPLVVLIITLIIKLFKR